MKLTEGKVEVVLGREDRKGNVRTAYSPAPKMCKPFMRYNLKYIYIFWNEYVLKYHMLVHEGKKKKKIDNNQ